MDTVPTPHFAILQIGQTLDLFKLEIGRYPTQQEGLQALVTPHRA